MACRDLGEAGLAEELRRMENRIHQQVEDGLALIVVFRFGEFCESFSQPCGDRGSADVVSRTGEHFERPGLRDRALESGAAEKDLDVVAFERLQFPWCRQLI